MDMAAKVREAAVLRLRDATDLVKGSGLLALSVLGSPVAFLLFFARHPLIVFAFFTPLLTRLLGRSDELLNQHAILLSRIPPFLLLGLAMLLVGLAKGSRSLGLILGANRWSLLLYAIVLVAELLVLLRDGVSSDYLYFFGRTGFIVVVFAVMVNFNRITVARSALCAFTVGVGILGLLTVLHAFSILSLPIAMRPLAARTFWGFRFPVRRALGIAMSYGKFGIMSSLAMAVLIVSALSPYKVIRRRFIRWVLGACIMAGVAISQGRGVYIAVATTMVLAIIVSLKLGQGQTKPARPAVWLLIIVIIGLVLAAALFFSPSVAEIHLLDVQTVRSIENIAARVSANRVGLQLLLRNPVLGIGHGNVAFLGMIGEDIHNHFLEQFVATGLVGGLPYLLFHLSILVKTWRMLSLPKDMEVRGLGGIMFVGVTATLLEYQVFPGFFTEAAAFLFGLVMSSYALGVARR